jgi:hypothetical protein
LKSRARIPPPAPEFYLSRFHVKMLLASDPNSLGKKDSIRNIECKYWFFQIMLDSYPESWKLIIDRNQCACYYNCSPNWLSRMAPIMVENPFFRPLDMLNGSIDGRCIAAMRPQNHPLYPVMLSKISCNRPAVPGESLLSTAFRKVFAHCGAMHTRHSDPSIARSARYFRSSSGSLSSRD